MQKIEAIVDETGTVRLKEKLRLPHPRRAIVTILDEEVVPNDALLSESSLAADWDRPEEDEAWSHLQSDQ